MRRHVSWHNQSRQPPLLPPFESVRLINETIRLVALRNLLKGRQRRGKKIILELVVLMWVGGMGGSEGEGVRAVSRVGDS